MYQKDLKRMEQGKIGRRGNRRRVSEEKLKGDETFNGGKLFEKEQK